MEKKFARPIIAVLVGLAVLVGGSIFLLQEGDAQNIPYTGPPKALIIDQLNEQMPNEIFLKKATQYLEYAGYTVDIVKTQDITVNFYKELPKMNYKYVVIRTHGADSTDDVVLFTGERYSEELYIQEQLFGQVKKATPLLEVSYKVELEDGSFSGWIKVNDTTMMLTTPAKPEITAKNEFFAVGKEFVDKAMDGKFDDTVFLLGGCNTMVQPTLANSLIDKGASMVLGWDNTVGSYDNDNALLIFLKDTLVDGLKIDESLKNVKMAHDPERMAYPASLIYIQEQ